jgi:CDP-4-dehydro-6-deoxyglucose reductase
MARPKTDVTISAPEVLQTPGRRVVQVGARVTTVDRINDDVAVVQLQVPIASGFGFHAGQYVDVVLRDGTRRSYSMANTPNDLGMIEWHVRAMPKGRFSNHVFNSLKPRDLIRIEGPYGSFRLKASDAPVVLLASGTGYAPIASMMRTHAAELRRRGATLFWGGHREADLYAMQEALAWQAESDMHRFVPVLSNPDEGWNGATGFVHEAVQRLYPDLSRHEVYACGNPLMVDAARQAFISQNHLDPSLYFSDAFISVLTPSVLTAHA